MKFLLVLILASSIAAAVTFDRLWTLPDRHNPWAALAYEDPPNWLTGYKLSRLSKDPAACAAWMRTTPWHFEAIADRVTGADCGWRNAVRVQRMAVQVGQAFTLTCPTAVSLALWERHVLQAQAQASFGVPVRSIEHYGSYACRNVYGREAGRRSQHASAEAFDIAGFVLENGHRITVARHWGDPALEAEFLRDLRDGACDFFDAVLGPEYNQAHADHFHFDRGPFPVCR